MLSSEPTAGATVSQISPGSLSRGTRSRKQAWVRPVLVKSTVSVRLSGPPLRSTCQELFFTVESLVLWMGGSIRAGLDARAVSEVPQDDRGAEHDGPSGEHQCHWC